MIWKAFDQRAKFAGRLVATIEPATNKQHRWMVVWTSDRAPERFDLASDAMGFVRRFYPEIKIEKGGDDEMVRALTSREKEQVSALMRRIPRGDGHEWSWPTKESVQLERQLSGKEEKAMDDEAKQAVAKARAEKKARKQLRRDETKTIRSQLPAAKPATTKPAGKGKTAAPAKSAPAKTSTPVKSTAKRLCKVCGRRSVPTRPDQTCRVCRKAAKSKK